MKWLFRLLSLAMLVCVLPRLYAADLSGSWKGSFEFNGRQMPTTIHLKVDGASVTGTVEGLPTSPADIHDGKLDGAALTFWVNTDYQGETYKLTFKGTVSDAKIDFDFGTDDGSWGTSMSVKRDAPDAAASADATGIWKGSFDLFGDSTPITFDLKSASGAVTGTVTSADGKPSEIHDGKLDGDTVTFWVDTTYEGQNYKVNYTGKLSAGQIDFNFGIPDGSWSSQVSAKKS